MDAKRQLAVEDTRWVVNIHPDQLPQFSDVAIPTPPTFRWPNQMARPLFQLPGSSISLTRETREDETEDRRESSGGLNVWLER